jgi:uncharacterized protein (TIGR02466 family)|tara:strand:+ start:368 stop:1000 length:633 start_codon:yes stop_codon:yes gene_type:complete
MEIKKDNNQLEIQMDSYFTSNIYRCYIPSWVKDLNKHSNKYIKDVKKLNLKGGQKDFGTSHCSYTLLDDNNFAILADFIKSVSRDILTQQGYDLSKKEVKLNDFWVQEFSKLGGGHQSYHTHPNNHISGFYFLKCSDNTSYPMFEDPRPGKVMTDLSEIDTSNISISTNKVFYKPKPGTLMLFNSYLPHQFAVDHGINPFRFIHFNLSAV